MTPWNNPWGRPPVLAFAVFLLILRARCQTVRNLSDTDRFSGACDRRGTTTDTAGRLAVSFVIGGQEILPFDVQGGAGVDLCAVRDGDQGRAVGRPSGQWDFVVDGRVPLTPQNVFNALSEFGNVLAYGFGNDAVKVRPLDDENKQYVVELNSGDTIDFTVEETDEDNKHHIVTLTDHSPGVTSGFSVAGSRLYFRVAPGDDAQSAVFEFGFETVVTAGFESSARILMESLFQEMLVNLGAKFGESCDLQQFTRTIEGDCNNLKRPRLGAANHALQRLPVHDPSFGDGVSSPGGALHISPRAISNAVFAESLGMDFLKQEAFAITDSCYVTNPTGATRWEVCIFGAATYRRDHEIAASLNWLGVQEHESGSMRFKWGNGDDCLLSVSFRCGGQQEIVISDNAGGVQIDGEKCGRHIGWLYTPRACKMDSGADVAHNPGNLTDMFWTMGQFIDHDVGLTPESELAKEKQPGFKDSRAGIKQEEFDIEVPNDEFYFINNRTLEFKRAVFIKPDKSEQGNALKFVNHHSAFLDLGQVYGVDFLRANALREHVDGKIKMGPNNLLPKNKLTGDGALGARVSNAPDADENMYVAGDIRANEQVTLLSMHILWAREHNKVCEELKAIFPQYNDQLLYETARAILISTYQSIVYTEWLPLLLGPTAVPKDAFRYDPNVDPSIMAFFSTVAFRFGHSMVPSGVWRMDTGNDPEVGTMALREVFFKPQVVEQWGIDPFLRGACHHVARNIDAKVNDDLRNFLFTEDENSPHMDLVALNIQRARDMGMPSYNDAREAYGLQRYTNFSQISSNEFVWRSIEHVYEGNINDVDAFVGGIAEDKYLDSQLGELFSTAIVDQFTRIRDGDRFFYSGVQWGQDILNKYPRLVRILNDEVKLADVIARNSGITDDEMHMNDRGTVLVAA